jgi:hypothetical protein
MRRVGVELPCHIDASTPRESSQHFGKSKWGHHLGRDLAEQSTNQFGLRLHFVGDTYLVLLPAMAGTAGRPRANSIAHRTSQTSERCVFHRHSGAIVNAKTRSAFALAIEPGISRLSEINASQNRDSPMRNCASEVQVCGVAPE